MFDSPNTAPSKFIFTDPTCGHLHLVPPLPLFITWTFGACKFARYYANTSFACSATDEAKQPVSSAGFYFFDSTPSKPCMQTVLVTSLLQSAKTTAPLHPQIQPQTWVRILHDQPTRHPTPGKTIMHARMVLFLIRFVIAFAHGILEFFLACNILLTWCNGYWNVNF